MSVPRDADRRILEEAGSRPWPAPERPWVMRQTWNDLLFAHWPVDTTLLRSRVPLAFEIDRFDGESWVGVVPFVMTDVGPRGVPPLPWLSTFAELNVRTYVKVGDKPGVFFFSLDAASILAVYGARMWLNLPYFAATIRAATRAGITRYSSRRKAARVAEFSATYQPVGPAFQPRPGSLDYFLTERYCLYAVDRQARPYRLEIHHAPWSLQAAEAQIERNSMSDAAGVALPAVPPLLHFSRRQDMVNWGPARIDD